MVPREEGGVLRGGLGGRPFGDIPLSPGSSFAALPGTAAASLGIPGAGRDPAGPAPARVRRVCGGQAPARERKAPGPRGGARRGGLRLLPAPRRGPAARPWPAAPARRRAERGEPALVMEKGTGKRGEKGKARAGGRTRETAGKREGVRGKEEGQEPARRPEETEGEPERAREKEGKADISSTTGPSPEPPVRGRGRRPASAERGSVT